MLTGIASTLVSALAGCAGGDESSDGTDAEAVSPSGDPAQPTRTRGAVQTAEPSSSRPPVRTVTATPTAVGTASARTTVTLDLDLREANVMAVSFERENGEVSFDVTLYHDDDGESGYANWWQVETLAGDRIGRRELAHAHGTREFTRSDRLDIPDGTVWVMVRGHDQEHGYGGRAMLVNLENGENRVAFQGADPDSFADFDG